MFTWVKLHQSLLSDVKVCKLTDGAFRLFIQLLLVANEQDSRDGNIPLDSDSREQIVFSLRIPDDVFEERLKELAAVGLVRLTANSCFITNFIKHQSSNTSTERVRKYRERQRQAKEAESASGGAETRVKHDETHETVDKTRKDEIRLYSTPVPLYEHAPAGMNNDMVEGMITQISSVVKTTRTFKSEAEFREAAYELIGRDAKPEDFNTFVNWWKTEGYQGKPAIKSLLDEWGNAMLGVKRSAPSQKAQNPKVVAVEKVKAAVQKYGTRDYNGAKTFLGDELVSLISQKMNGWRYVCGLSEEQLKFAVFSAMGEQHVAVS